MKFAKEIEIGYDFCISPGDREVNFLCAEAKQGRYDKGGKTYE
jgi:hypothetical protein